VALLVLPIVPAASLESTPINDVYAEAGEQVGWPELVATVDGVIGQMPAEDRGAAVILTANYGEAGALELLGAGVPVVSGHNAYWDWGPPADDRRVVRGQVLSPGDFSGCRSPQPSTTLPACTTTSAASFVA
jgi:hypothetical protein